MKTRTKAVVIGGGIAGCSTLYHLTQEGWNDVMLLERDNLTSGTTWHSAAQVTNFGMTQTMVGLKSHSIALYKDLADDPDYPINDHHGDGGGDGRAFRGHRRRRTCPAPSADIHRHPDWRPLGSDGWRYRPGAAVSGVGAPRPQGRR